MKLFSIVTINFNNESGLLQTFHSVLEQNKDLFEFIVIDGGSIDGSIQIIKDYKPSINQVIIEADAGIYDAMNKGIQMASGKYLWFLNSGDCFYSKNTLTHCASEIENQSEFDIYYGAVNVNYNNTYSRVKENGSLLQLWQRMPFSHQAAFCLTDLYKNQPFELKYSIIADQAFFYKQWLSKSNFRKVDSILAQIEPGGTSEQYPRKVRDQKLKMLKETDTLSLSKQLSIDIEYFIRTFIRGLKKIFPTALVDILTRLKYKV